MSSPAFRFRLATLDDAPALLSIYAPYVEKTAISFEYDVPSLDEFRRRIADISRKYPYLVAEDENGQLLGYAYTHTFIARKAYRAIEELSLAQNIYNLYACIGEPQGADDEYLTDNSIRFHEHMGFRRIGVFTRSGCKFGRWYNMSWAEKLLMEHPEHPEPVIPFPQLDKALVADILRRAAE